MALSIITAMAVKNDCYKKATPMNPVGIVVHSTAANNPYLKRYVDAPAEVGVNAYGNTWNNSSADMGRQTCVHAFIGYDIQNVVRVAQILPYNYACWGVGGGSKGSYNYNPVGHVQFEMQEDNTTDSVYFGKMWDVSTEYCAELCKKYNWNPLGTNVIVSHKEACALGYGSNHGDPEHWLVKHGKTMSAFRNEVKRKLDLINIGSTPATPTPVPTPSPVVGNFNKGDVVQFAGGPVYSSSNATSATVTGNTSRCKVTQTYNGKHPYHCISEDGKGVYGWVDSAKVSAVGSTPVTPTPAPAPAKKSNEEIANEVLNGAWGNGDDRKNRLAAAGYDYSAIQAIVNGKSAHFPTKSNDQIANEVIKGLWGNGDDRKKRLTASGYNPSTIQAIVNQKLK